MHFDESVIERLHGLLEQGLRRSASTRSKIGDRQHPGIVHNVVGATLA